MERALCIIQINRFANFITFQVLPIIHIPKNGNFKVKIWVSTFRLACEPMDIYFMHIYLKILLDLIILIIIIACVSNVAIGHALLDFAQLHYTYYNVIAREKSIFYNRL